MLLATGHVARAWPVSEPQPVGIMHIIPQPLRRSS